jgi:hypothetical protein
MGLEPTTPGLGSRVSIARFGLASAVTAPGGCLPTSARTSQEGVERSVLRSLPLYEVAVAVGRTRTVEGLVPARARVTRGSGQTTFARDEVVLSHGDWDGAPGVA